MVVRRTYFLVPLFALLMARPPAVLTAPAEPSTSAFGFDTIEVTTTADTASANGQCSLREAIINANDNASTYPECGAPGAGNVSIQFQSGLGTATITLTSTLPNITRTAGMTINGAGRITISGNNLYRVFIVNPSADITLESLTVASGRATGDCATDATDKGYGGAIRNDAGSVTIQNSTFANNVAVWVGGCGGHGGAISHGADPASPGGSRGTLTVNNSTFSGNQAGGNGGAIYNNDAWIDISRSTFLNNTSAAPDNRSLWGGGAIFNYGALTISNSTFGSNTSADSNGGGIFTQAGTVTLINNTFSGNSGVSGGDIYNYGSTLDLYNNILANSLGGGNCARRSTGNVVNAGDNINEDASNDCGLLGGSSGNIVGSDPSLDSLFVPSGSTAYFPLLAGSIAIDAGDDAKCAAAPVNNTSQNGLTRPKGAHCDIGSYERGLEFTDPVLTPGQTVIKAVHITELRTRIDAIRSARSLPAYSWGAALVAGSSTVLASHILDLREALRQAYVQAGLTPPTYTNTAAGGTIVRAVDITELRAAVVAIE